MMLNLAIVLGSTRPGRKGEPVARWVYERALCRSDAQFDFVDVKDFSLPLLDEPFSPAQGNYTKDYTKVWSHKIDACDGFVFVTPEYNHSTSAALKNALDYLYREWNNKAAGFVSYGSQGGIRAVEHLRAMAAELQMATVRQQVALSLFSDFDDGGIFRPAPIHERHLHTLFEQLVAWSGALRTVREKTAATP